MSDKNVDQKGEELKGRTKEAAGSMTDDRELKREGRTDQLSSDAKSKLDSAVDSIKDAVKKVTRSDD